MYASHPPTCNGPPSVSLTERVVRTHPRYILRPRSKGSEWGIRRRGFWWKGERTTLIVTLNLHPNPLNKITK